MNHTNLFKQAVTLAACLFLIFIQIGCTSNVNLKKGIYRAELIRDDGQSIVFNFTVADTNQNPVIYIQNAEERLRVDSIILKGDSVRIQMPFFDSYFAAKIEANGDLTGKWIKNYATRLLEMPFKAKFGDSSRLVSHVAPKSNVSGTWETTLTNEVHQYKAIGMFKQDGVNVTGTFLVPSGDYRYLQGVVSGDTLKMSAFDGSHTVLFQALVKGDSLLNGQIYSTNSEPRPWFAGKKDYEELPSSFDASNITAGTIKLDFHLKDMKTGEEVSLNSPKYQGKVVVLSMMGSWCPNCMDETPFLISYYQQNKDRGVEILGIDVERTDNFDQSKLALNSFFNRFDINYPILFSGVSVSDTAMTKKLFPTLPTKIAAFPTTIFIDKSGYVRTIHGGFNGPATGKYYDQYQEEFAGIINGLLAE